MNLNKKQIAFNTSRRTQPIKYIVIHDTGNSGKGANATSHFNYFNGGDRQSSADFFVDETQVLQVNDYNKCFTWHCGDGRGRYGITNGNSVGVEICMNCDGDYSKAFANAVELTRYLMGALGIGAAHVVRHYDASRKNCPASMAGNGWAKWGEFKMAVQNKELTSVNDIVWELAHRGILSQTDLWLAKLEQDADAYWLARKMVAFLQRHNV